KLEPLIATPSSPGNVVRVSEVAGKPIYQAYIGSSANPGWRDFAVAAEIVRGGHVPVGVSFDVNPTSRETLEALIVDGRLAALVGARASTRPVATAASAWARRQRSGAIHSARRRATFPAVRAPRRTRYFSARRKPPPPRRLPGELPIRAR